MSQYEQLDALILAACGRISTMPVIHDLDVKREAKRISLLTGREEFRIIDGRLQSLRKAGKITYSSLHHRVNGGWSIAGDAK